MCVWHRAELAPVQHWWQVSKGLSLDLKPKMCVLGWGWGVSLADRKSHTLPSAVFLNSALKAFCAQSHWGGGGGAGKQKDSRASHLLLMHPFYRLRRRKLTGRGSRYTSFTVWPDGWTLGTWDVRLGINHRTSPHFPLACVLSHPQHLLKWNSLK